MKLHLPSTLLALLLVGCVTSSKKLTKLSPGMPKAQVLEILGEPKSVSSRDGSEFLRYQLSGRDAPLIAPTSYAHADGYTVQLTDGRVVAFGRDD
jgi:hypothetical protein